MSTDAKASVELIKAVEWTLESPGRLHRSVTSLPTPTADEVLVTTKVGAISPGTERVLLHGNAPRVAEKNYPHQPGRMNVVTIREAADRTLIGDRGVVCLGHRDHALVPYSRFIRIPAGIPDDVALLGILAADAHHATEVANVETDEDCLVVGGGILGALTAWELAVRTRGAIRLLERSARRRARLKEITFPAKVRIAERAGRYPFHTVFECANTKDAFRTAQAAARPGGSIVVVADGSHESYGLTSDFFANGLFLGKTDENPDLRGFLNDWFARGDDRTSLVSAAFREDVRFDEFPQAYLKSALTSPDDAKGLLPRVLY